jgi:hypothetical protein
MSITQIGDPVRELKTAGHDLCQIPLARLPPSIEKAAFLCVNSYHSYRSNLGIGPINDAVLFARCMKSFKFEIYFVHNPHAENFLQYLDAFVAAVSKHLVIYYVGQGTKVRTEGEEAFVFDDGPVMEEEFIAHLKKNKNPTSKIVLATDACHSGSVWDLQPGSKKAKALPPGLITLSVVSDVQPPKQTMVAGVEQGAFTYNLTKTLQLEPLVTPGEISGKLRPVLKKYAQTFSVGTTTPALLSRPIFT